MREGCPLKREIYLRVTEAARYIAREGATVRACAERFGVSKTTIHKDMRERLPQIDSALAGRVDAVLRRNRAERHLRGGAATRRKYAGSGGTARGRRSPGIPDAGTALRAVPPTEEGPRAAQAGPKRRGRARPGSRRP